jgi:ubiquinone/menaquinone biosynthesis C-methylase UbiE
LKILQSKTLHKQFLQDEKTGNNAWLNPEHPNFERWKRARELSFERGKFVESIIEIHLKFKDLMVLDLGSGEGGTSIIFSEQNIVFSYDLNLMRLERQKNNLSSYNRINGDALKLPIKNNSFDLIILQDIIEHVTNAELLINEIRRVLKTGGVIYISTPNKYSIFNFIADPHWGLPIVSSLKRESIKKYFLKFFRKSESNRKDIPQLFSLNDIMKYFGKYFEIKLETIYSAEKLLNGDKGIVWSNFHLGLIKFIRKIKIEKILLLLSNNNMGIINNYFTPTFYLIAKKIK